MEIQAPSFSWSSPTMVVSRENSWERIWNGLLIPYIHLKVDKENYLNQVRTCGEFPIHLLNTIVRKAPMAGHHRRYHRRTVGQSTGHLWISSIGTWHVHWLTLSLDKFPFIRTTNGPLVNQLAVIWSVDWHCLGSVSTSLGSFLWGLLRGPLEVIPRHFQCK